MHIQTGKLCLAIIFSAACLAVPASAQVISGESTYEDNFVHTPPAEAAKPAGRDAVTKTDDGALSRRDGRARDRD